MDIDLSDDEDADQEVGRPWFGQNDVVFDAAQEQRPRAQSRPAPTAGNNAQADDDWDDPGWGHDSP